jgi:glutamine---fructose-6-phosphate transaminase (isomerizing)
LSDHGGVDSLVQSPDVSSLGAHSLAEILSQPQFWARTLRDLQSLGAMADLRQRVEGAAEWLFIGCGSSYYVALSAAATWTAATGQRARAVAASELLLFPELFLSPPEKRVAALISRSGSTSETIKVARLLGQHKNVTTLAISVSANSPLEKATAAALPLPEGGEKSTVMTLSFTSMLLGLQYLAATWGGDQVLLESLARLPAAAEPVLKSLHPQIRHFVTERDFADYVCLGQGPFYGLACETALKITEMSVSYSQSFHTLEFRHGPKSIVGPETLVIFLLSEQAYDAECGVLEEIKSLGGTTIAIANRADQRARDASDLLIELNFDLPELARLAPYIFVGQLIGLYTGRKKNLDPDNPRNLTRVVILND